MHWPGSMGGGSGTQLGGAMGGDTGSWWSLEDAPDSWRPRPAALSDLRIISLKRRLVRVRENATGHLNDSNTVTVFWHYLRTCSVKLDWRDCRFLLKTSVQSFTPCCWRSPSCSQNCCLKPQRWHWRWPPQQTDALHTCFSQTAQLLESNKGIQNGEPITQGEQTQKCNRVLRVLVKLTWQHVELREKCRKKNFFFKYHIFGTIERTGL